MKRNVSRGIWKNSIASAIVLGFFIILAISSVDLYIPLGIDVQMNYLGDGVFEERELHAFGNQIITTSGPRDAAGRWHGWVEIEYRIGLTNQLLYSESVYMVHGKRNGLSTRVYPDGNTEEEHYLNGMKVSGLKSTNAGPAEGPAFELLQQRHPWYLFMLEAFRFDNQVVKNYLDTLETLLGEYTFDPAEFDTFYDVVVDSLSVTPYDSIVQSTNTLTGSIGIQRMKDDELRLAVIDHYRSLTDPTFQVLERMYPRYVQQMIDMGINAADLEVFCNDLDDSLAVSGNLNPEDLFFVDSVDARFMRALLSFTDIDDSEEGLKSSGVLRAGWGNLNAAAVYYRAVRKLSGTANTPAEVAETALLGLIFRLLEGDYMRQMVYDAYMSGQGISGLPVAGTEFIALNSASSATIKGYVIEDGGAAVNSRGIAWAEQRTPSIDDQFLASGSGTGAFTVTLEGLKEDHTYYARSYATNSEGTVYGNLISFTAISTVGTGNPEAFRTGMKLYPNPATVSVTVEFMSASNARRELVLMDMSGKTIARKVVSAGAGTSHRITLDLNGFTRGIYLLRLLENGMPVAVEELIVQ